MSLAWAIVAGWLVLPQAGHADDVSLSASVSRTRLYAGESVLLTVRVAGTDDPSLQPDLSALREASIRPLGSQSLSRHSITMINGRVSREDFEGREYTYEVTPAAEGDFRLGPIRLDVGGRGLSDPGPTITVVGVEKQDRVEVHVQASRTAVLVEESFDVTLVVRIRALAPPYADSQPLDPNNPPLLRIPYLDTEMPGLDAPETREILQGILSNRRGQPGFRINDYTVQGDPFGGMFDFNLSFNDMRPRPAVFVLSPQQRVDAGGVPVWEYTLTTQYTSKDEGEHTFGPIQFKGSVIAGATGDGRPVMRDVFAVGPAVTVRVIPPPEQGRPDTYAGVLGTNMTVSAALDTQECNVGDPLRLTLTVSGDVNLDKLRLPPVWERPEFTALFRAYPDTLQTRREDGRVEASVTLRPTQAGTVEVPPVTLSYFNTATRQYADATSRPVPLQVNASTVLTADHVLAMETNRTDSVDAAATGRRPPAPITVSAEGPTRQSLLGGAPQLAVAAAGPAVFALTATWLLMLAVVRRRAATAAHRKALRRALRRLRTTPRETADTPERYRRISLALRQYVSDRTTTPGAQTPTEGLTPADCRERLIATGVASGSVARFMAVLTRVFEAGFSTGVADNIEAEAREAEAVLRDLERQWRRNT